MTTAKGYPFTGRSTPRPEERPSVSAEAPQEEPPRAQDHWRVNLAEAWEVIFWKRQLQCTEGELRKAVQAAGDLAGAVRAYLAMASSHNF
jgi:hypothetical protein